MNIEKLCFFYNLCYCIFPYLEFKLYTNLNIIIQNNKQLSITVNFGFFVLFFWVIIFFGVSSQWLAQGLLEQTKMVMPPLTQI